MASQAAEYVADVVGRGDALLKGAVPAVEDAPDDLNAGVVEVGYGDVEAVLVCTREMFPVGERRGWAVEVGAYICYVSIWLFISGSVYKVDNGCLLPVRMAMILPKSTSPSVAARTSTSNVALSSCALIQ